MSRIPDADLETFAERVRGKVVLITGGANGIGKATALRFAKHGAKILIADQDEESGKHTESMIVEAGGDALFCKCDILSWDDQVNMYEAAVARYDSVDIVFANAGINEAGVISEVQLVEGRPVKPNLITLEIDLVGAIYTIHLAMHYLRLKQAEGDLKSIVAMSSMAAWQNIPSPVYGASKLGLLGFMRSLQKPCALKGIRLGVVHPFFANTTILKPRTKALLVQHNFPFVPVDRIAGAVLLAASDPDMATTCAAYLLMDGGEVVCFEQERITKGIYKEFDRLVDTVLLK